VHGPGGEAALFTSQPAQTRAGPQTLRFADFSRRVGEYARARKWRVGPLTVTRVGLELGWQIPVSRATTDTRVTIETGDRVWQDGPDTYGRLAGDAQWRLRAGNADGAIEDYAAALLLRANDLDGQLALGEVFHSAKRWQDGVAFYAALSRDYPNDPWIRYNLATMQRGLGDFDAARATIADFVTIVPEISHEDGTAGTTNARIAATRRAIPAPTGTTYAMTLEYDTGDGSVDQIYLSLNGAPEVLVTQGPIGKGAIPDQPLSTQLVYRMYAGTGHTTLVGSVTISYTVPRLPQSQSRLMPWLNLLQEQLVLESDVRAGRPHP
jgi:tetratricopeptide (TPR) repeat protein